MPTRSIASLALSFGLVSIPVKLYSATESSSAIRFKLMGAGGVRVRQQYVVDPAPLPEQEPVAAPATGPTRTAAYRTAEPKVIEFPAVRQPAAMRHEVPAAPDDDVVERSAMFKGYEYEKGKFVLFTPEELKSLASESRKTIDIVAFIPEKTIDPIFYDKAYFLAPDKRGSKPYSLLLRAMRDTGRCAVARWAFRSKEYAVQIRAVEGGMVLQQLLYATEVRTVQDFNIHLNEVGEAELALAKQLIAQISADSYDPTQFVDEEKQRILQAVERKIAGNAITPVPARSTPGQVVDLIAALRASLQTPPLVGGLRTSKPSQSERKPARQASRGKPVQGEAKSRGKRL